MKNIFLTAICLLTTILNAQENYNMQLRSHLEFPGKSCANIWGYADPQGNEYALVGTSTGLSIVDVTNPSTPQLLFEVPSVENFWREVKTWQGYAYMTTEGDNAGLTVIDLTDLPNSIDYQVYDGDGAIANQLSTIHALHIDNGKCYLYGSNIGVGGMLILDLADPWNPSYIGQYDNYYVHDGIVFGDTAWAGNIYDGFFTVIDVSDPANPIELTQQETPGNFTHNTWLSDDRKYLLTTDEIPNSYLTSYSIDDIGNISEEDRFQTAAGSNCIVHNTHILNDYAVTSWYTEGVVIVDNDRPNNLIEVAKYDFSDFEGDGFNGCWGVYPYLPSGNIIASDIETGLWVLTPTYQRACYFEGTVTDSICGTNLEGVTVTIGNNLVTDSSNINGIFRTGTVVPGTYSVTFSKPGYNSQTFNNLVFENGALINLDVVLFSETTVPLAGIVLNDQNQPVNNASVYISNSLSGYNFNTDALGEYNRCDLQPDLYTVVAGNWGYVTSCQTDVSLSSANADVTSILQLGYYDDFQFNFGWTQSATSAAGFWERAIPVGTILTGNTSNANIDADGDCNGFAFVTGNAPGNGPGSDDVDDGYSRLVSPVMDLSNAVDPHISFKYWFFNGGGNSTPNDTLYVIVSQNNVDYSVAKFTTTQPMSQWVDYSFRVKDFIDQPANVQFKVEAFDFLPGHIVEAGIDMFKVESFGFVGIENNVELSSNGVIQPNPSNGEAFLNLQEPAKDITITDLSGRVISIINNSTNQLQVQLPSDLKSGLYLVTHWGTNGSGTLRWMKQ
jgi:choice-of-anchor B domain-containing protein